MLVGFVLNLLPIHQWALAFVAVYATYFGVIEWARRPGLRAPAINWQVPQTFVINASRRRRTLIWGAILGPGFATRNAYAGFGLLVLAVAAVGNIQYGTSLAAVIGVAHASSRAIALIRDAQRACAADYLQTTIKKMRWRAVDGLLLLVIAGAAVIAFVQTF
jgi:hypothetical protein